MRYHVPMRRAALLAALLAASGCGLSSFPRRIKAPVVADYSVEDPQFQRSLGQLVDAPPLSGNRVTPLVDGGPIFAAMLESIAGAKRSIDLEMYLFKSGRVGDRFVAALTERAKAGVPVRVIVDAVGSYHLNGRDRRRLRKAGVRLSFFHPLLTFHLSHLDRRTHRKLLIIDGRVAYTGGVGINDKWLGPLDLKHWHDTQYRVEGPVVAQLQGVFAAHWLELNHEVLEGDAYFPALEPAGGMSAQAIASGAGAGVERTRLAYLFSIAAARKSIRIGANVFSPDKLLIDALVKAMRRGVPVEIIVSAKSNIMLVEEASRRRWRRLIEAGATLYEYRPALYHCKIFVVDGVWTIVGSTNLDERSFRLNEEADLGVMDAGFAAQVNAILDADKAASTELTLTMLRRQRLRDWFDRIVGVFRPEL